MSLNAAFEEFAAGGEFNGVQPDGLWGLTDGAAEKHEQLMVRVQGVPGRWWRRCDRSAGESLKEGELVESRHGSWWSVDTLYPRPQ